MKFNYNFPAAEKFIPSSPVTRTMQAIKIDEESKEVSDAIDSIYTDTGCYVRPKKTRENDYIVELLDVIHAAETSLREFNNDEIQRAFKTVIEKNKKRGYYDVIN